MDDEALRRLLKALHKYRIRIDNVPHPELRRRLRELAKEQGKATS